MEAGQTFIEINYNAAWIQESIAGVQGFLWLYEWGMYLFLIATLAVLFWIFFDSITKHKDQQALVPRILAMIGFFMIIPAFIFRFTGNADGVHTLVRLGGEPGTPYYPGPINWNVNWLVSGFGPIVAIVALLGVVLSLIGLVIYASSVQRAKPSTEFVNAFDNRMNSLERKVEEASRTPRPQSMPQSTPPKGSTSATIIDRKPQAATVIDIPRTGDTIIVRSNNGRGFTYDLPEADVVFGRDPSCFAVIDDAKVSGRHLKLAYAGDVWYAIDMGSTNGSYLNGGKLIGQQALRNGDEIRIGDTTLQFGSK